jgi:hypothetical protein
MPRFLFVCLEYEKLHQSICTSSSTDQLLFILFFPFPLHVIYSMATRALFKTSKAVTPTCPTRTKSQSFFRATFRTDSLIFYHVLGIRYVKDDCAYLSSRICVAHRCLARQSPRLGFLKNWREKVSASIQEHAPMTTSSFT